MTPDPGGLDGARIALAVALTAGLGVAAAEAFLRFYPRAHDVGPTGAALGDAFAWIVGACLGLLAGSCLASLLVRRGSHFFAGVFAGVAGFWIGVAPYVLLTAPSDVSVSDALGFVLIVFVPGLLFVTAGAALGTGVDHVLHRVGPADAAH
jgi:hypothetical protein